MTDTTIHTTTPTDNVGTKGALTRCHYATPRPTGPRPTDEAFVAETNAAIGRYMSALARELEAFVGTSEWNVETDLRDYVYNYRPGGLLSRVGITKRPPRAEALYECALYLRSARQLVQDSRFHVGEQGHTPDEIRVQVGGYLSEARDHLVTLYTNRVFGL